MNIEEALGNPARFFSDPEAIVGDGSLSREQKIRLLRRWEYDALELQVAEEENMGGGPADLLDRILRALHQVEAVVDVEHSPPTKHGGE